MTVTKVEPWNSVRITLNISKDAALNLQRLAEEDGQLLRDLGILSVQLHGNQSVYVGEASHDDVASASVGNRFREASGKETDMQPPCTSERLDAGHGQRLFPGHSSLQGFTGKQEWDNMVMTQNCFQDGRQPLEHFVYPPGIRSYFRSPSSQSAAWYSENLDRAGFSFSSDRLAFHQVSGGAFDNTIGTRSVSQFSESKQLNVGAPLRGRPRRHMQSTGFALCSNRPSVTDHLSHHHSSSQKSSSAQETNCILPLMQSYGSTDVGTRISNHDVLFHRQWYSPSARTSAAQRRPLREETMQSDIENDSLMRRHAGSDPWSKDLRQESKEIYHGIKMTQSCNRRQQSLSSESCAAVPVTNNPMFLQRNCFQSTQQHSGATDCHVQSNFLNNQISSVPLKHLAKSQASALCQTTVCLGPNIDPYPGKLQVSDTRNSTTVESEYFGMAFPEARSPDMSAFSPASPEGLSRQEDGVFSDTATLLGAESSKLAVERALSLLSDTTDDAFDLPMEKECHQSSHLGLLLSSPTGSFHQGILGKFQAYSQDSNSFSTRTQLIRSVAPNRMQSFNRVDEIRRKSLSASTKASRFSESFNRRGMPCLSNVNDDLNYPEPKSRARENASGYCCKGTVPTFSDVASSSAMLEVTSQNNVDSRSGRNYVEGHRDCNTTSLGSSFLSSAMSSPIQQDMVKVSHSPLMLPCDRFALSSKSPKFNITPCTLSLGLRLSPSSSAFPPALPAGRDSFVRFSCRTQSQDRLQIAMQTPEGGVSSASPRDTCSWMESDLCSSIPDSGIASNTSSGGSSDLSELERTLGGSLENFNRYQEAADARDGCMPPDGASEEGTDASCTTTSHEAPPSVSVYRQATGPGRAVGFGSPESHVGICSEGTTSVVQQSHDKDMSFEQRCETLKQKALGLLEGHTKNDNSVRMNTICNVSSMRTNSEGADSCQGSRVKLRIARNSTNGGDSSSRGDSSSGGSFEPLITCPSLPHRLSESVKLAMQGVSPGGTTSDTFSARGTSAPMEAMQASTIIRITKTRSGGIHSKQKDTWSIQPVVRCRQEKQNDEQVMMSSENCELPPKPYTTEGMKSPTADSKALQSNDFNCSSRNTITSSKNNKLCSLRLKPGRNSTFANSLRTKRLETGRPVCTDRHNKPWVKGQMTGEFKQFALSGSQLLADRTLENCSRTKVKRLNCVQMHSADG